ncbi:MAG: sulfatase [Verrucomicrobiota bacterium]
MMSSFKVTKIASARLIEPGFRYASSLKSIWAIFFFLVSFHLEAVQAEEKPNIVFLLADDMNRDCWGVYGSVDCKTPHIDRLAGEGVRFERAYASVAMCAPFRQELYSGRSPWRTRTLANHSKSHPDTQSIPHYLKPLGYRVALMGKSHVGPKEVYPFEYIKGGNKAKDTNPHLLQEARKFFDACSEEKTPFCLFIASNDSHAPFTTGDRSAYKASELTIPPYWLDTPELRETLVQYYAEITNFDALVGMIRAELEQRGLWEETIFFVCSEQGTQLPFAKWTCYDNGLRSGLVAHWSGAIQPGSSVKELISIADVAPTLVEAAGGTWNDGDFDGASFLKMLQGAQQVNHDYVYGAFTNCNIIDNRDRIFPIRVVRDKQYTLIFNPNHESQTSNLTLSSAKAILDGNEPKKMDIAASWVQLSREDATVQSRVHLLHHRPKFELYDLDADPYELNNLIDHPEYAQVADRLQQALMAQLEKLGDTDPIATEKSLMKNKNK